MHNIQNEGTPHDEGIPYSKKELIKLLEKFQTAISSYPDTIFSKDGKIIFDTGEISILKTDNGKLISGKGYLITIANKEAKDF